LRAAAYRSRGNLWLDRVWRAFRLALDSAVPWIDDGFGGRFNEAKKAAGLERLHFHDLRGTAATRFYTAGLDERVIAEIMGWSEESVRGIIH
jgi:integrase